MNLVKVWKEDVVIPTYEVGEADKNPVFCERRVYQGSSGKVYPYPVIEKIYDVKTDKTYRAVYLENQYIRVMILPELGGRIQRAYDKTNNYDFVYYNRVIKPALVGLVGPWISGGIEFNWPQHHRPTTFMPVDYTLTENDDGSKTVLVNDIDRMYGSKGIAAFTLYPDKAYIEIKGQLYNRTPHPQTFLWWANPAVAVNDHTQSIFPPDVRAVMDHGKRDVSRFPIATGVYYKKDYSEGVDISRYKNIPVPTSFMAEKSDFDFIGGYDHNLKAGILHVADHHVSPGKKQWTWGCGDFGKVWDKNLTDEDGPYVELMTGVYTDNQPDFTWLKPFEEKTFKQYFMPYKAVGAVKNATVDAAVNLETDQNRVYICAYATSRYEDAHIVLYRGDEVCFEEGAVLSPVDIFERTLEICFERDTELTLKVIAGEKTLVQYTPLEQNLRDLPKPAEAAKEPEEIMTVEELYLTGLHLEQYRHATYAPDRYYLEGLKRDPGDIRTNNALGSLYMRRGMFSEAEALFRKAIERLSWKNPNPYNSEPYYNLGLSLIYQGRDCEAYEAFFKATWSSEQQEQSFYYLAALTAKKGDFAAALELLEKGLSKNTRNIRARSLKAVLLRKLGKTDEARAWLGENLGVDRFDYVSRFESALIDKDDGKTAEMNRLARNFHENYLTAGTDYAEAGFYAEAVAILRQCTDKKPMLKYYEAYYNGRAGEIELAQKALAEAAGYPSLYCFPNKPEDVPVLQYAIECNPYDAKAPYYLGLLFYDKKQPEKAVALWELSASIDSAFPTVYRNLALAYYNHARRPQKAREALEKAFFLDTTDARVFLELDQLYKKLEMPFGERLAFYDKYHETYTFRDDLAIEYITLLNLTGEHGRAFELIKQRKFHPWEGGEGKITAQYTVALIELARQSMREGNFQKAKERLEQALVYPENLGEGKLEGTKDNHIYYYLGCAHEELGDKAKAKSCFEAASAGETQVAGMMYYNDQPADMVLFQGLAKLKLGRTAEANARFYKLLDYGESHIFDNSRIEYFAVSLPDFLIFEDDLNRKNKAHCHYLIALGNLGLGKTDEAAAAFDKALAFDRNHFQCVLYKKMIGQL